MRSFGGGWGSGPGPEPGPAPEDADAYAQRLWEEMQRRQRASSGAPSAAAQATWGAADAAARARDGRRGAFLTWKGRPCKSMHTLTTNLCSFKLSQECFNN